MRDQPLIKDVEIRHFHIACGIGGGALGFNQGAARVGNLRAKFRCIGGVDIDHAALADFLRIAGVPGTLLDLFNREQYVAFHGRHPPKDWREATPEDMRRAAGGERPHIVFGSLPCKGNSGLLAEAQSKSPKYQALNALALRGIWLMLEAWKDDPVELVIFENVPRIAQRSRALLDQIGALLRANGYAVAETTHDCGEIGGLAQSRKRFLLVARHMAKVPPFLYEPPKHKLRGVGEVLDKLPLPLSGVGGPMHRMPALQWKTWVRLAFVKAGADWRSLNDLRVDNGVLTDFGIAPDAGYHSGLLGVTPWEAHASTVKGRSGPTNGAHSVADPRSGNFKGALGVTDWREPTGTVAGESLPSNGKFAVADPRAGNLASAERQAYGVGGWKDPAATITSARSPGQGRFAVADPRRQDGRAEFGQYGVKKWDEPGQTVISKAAVGAGNFSVSDPRITGKRFNTTFRIVPFDAPAPAVAGPGGPAGGLAVADPRSTGSFRGKGKYQVAAFDKPANTVIGASSTGHGASAVADPRPGYGPDAHKHVMRVTPWDQPGGTVTSGHSPSNGALSVADPRTNYGEGKQTNTFAVTPFDAPARTVTGANQPQRGALSVADPRPEFAKNGRKSFETGGHYGVVPYDEPAGTVSGAGQHDNGRFSVADPRLDAASSGGLLLLPEPSDQLICVIRALDGTWHRPFTTLELAALQSLVDPEEFLELEGLSDSAWRERIGNAVPPAASAAIASVMGRTLLMAWSGTAFMLSSEAIWVQPIALALSTDTDQFATKEDDL